MFAYLVIALELVLLYTAFWYVFVREPKPRIIERGQWGSYQRISGRFTAYGDLFARSDISNAHISNTRISNKDTMEEPTTNFTRQFIQLEAFTGYPGKNFSIYLTSPQASPHERTPYTHSPKVSPNHSETISRYGWVVSQDAAYSKSIISKILFQLGRTFHSLSVKLP